jgi:hypothetical protein
MFVFFTAYALDALQITAQHHADSTALFTGIQIDIAPQDTGRTHTAPATVAALI